MISNNSIIVSNFSKNYPMMNKFLIENGEFLDSRVGSTKELISFKTTVKNPRMRCVGGLGRNINVFFLIAEAMWIFAGKKDVETLDLFNSNMKQFSDDGKSFNAPYGFRIRKHGLSSFEEIKVNEENQHFIYQDHIERDQLRKNINLLNNDPNTRRSVISIWNPDLDLDTVSLDLPCNDLIFFKVRNNKLNTTISNRSNDLHLGLTTNLFQFSYLSEIVANILNLDLGQQTHNSDSLHVYLENPITFKLYEGVSFSNEFTDLYDVSSPFKIDMNFNHKDVNARLEEVDYFHEMILNSLLRKERLEIKDFKKLAKFSNSLSLCYCLLHIFLDYKYKSKRSKEDKIYSISKINILIKSYGKLDILALAQNFFYSRINETDLPSDLSLITKNYL